jgi:hypothetical protein
LKGSDVAIATLPLFIGYKRLVFHLNKLGSRKLANIKSLFFSFIKFEPKTPTIFPKIASLTLRFLFANMYFKQKWGLSAQKLKKNTLFFIRNPRNNRIKFKTSKILI